MSIAKGKERAVNPTSSTITIAIIVTIIVLAKDTFPRIKSSDTFSGDRKKFKAYETEYRIYFWADTKRED
jgi:hypothetical protein